MRTIRLSVKSFSVIILLGFCLNVQAHEGMWIPSTLSKLVIDDMRNAGLKLTAEEIYSINQSSLKDAIVHFGGGCTAEVISTEGLILTNHHCGYSQIQTHSSVQNDYLKDGFWAMNRVDELPNSGLTATFVVRIEDVTAQIAEGLGTKEGAEKQQAMVEVVRNIKQQAILGTSYDANVKPFFYGNAFYLIITETFRDVRLVGAPPSGIGKFGGDTDNWEWPRHTGDFSIFRIYADKDNNPALFSPANVPYTPKRSLSVSMDGVNEGDYTMVFGFPGKTEQYISSYAVDYILSESNPMRIAMREASLAAIDAAMAANDSIRIQYAAKQSRISNAYKKWIGQSQGLKAYNALGKKRADEMAFRALAETKDAEGISAEVLDLLDELYLDNNQYALAADYYVEFYYYGPELLRFSSNFSKLLNNYDSLYKAGAVPAEIERLRKMSDSFFKNYNKSVDQKIFAAQAPLFTRGAPGLIQSPTLSRIMNSNGGEGIIAAAAIYRNTPFASRTALETFFNKPSAKAASKMRADAVFSIAEEILGNYAKRVKSNHEAFRTAEELLMAEYLEAKMMLDPEKKYWPDANATLRITYGKMEGSEPRDGMAYLPYTTLDGIVQKYIPGDVDFDVPERLLELHTQKDYGPYTTDGELRVCFLGSNHTTGGNSGSPALNAWGDLVGLNFDRTWESTMSDIMFNPDICRNIMVDIKYILFVIDKYAGAKHLIEEMNLISRKEASVPTQKMN